MFNDEYTHNVVLYGLLFSVIEVDEFTSHLWKIYETVREEGIAQVIY